MSMSIYDYVRLAALIVIVIVLATQKAKTFILVDAVLTVTSGVLAIWGFSPLTYESESTVAYNGLHVLLFQTFMCAGVMPALFYLFFARSAKDDDAAQGLLATRTLTIGLCTFIMALNQWRHPKIFKDTHVSVRLSSSVLWFCLAAFALYRSGITPPRRGRISAINLYIKIDIVIAALYGSFDLLFARFAGSLLSGRFDLLHEHILTLEGAANLSTAVLGVYALGVRNIAERKGYLCCRLTVLLLSACCLACGLYNKKLSLTGSDMAVFASGFIPVIPAVTGLVLTGDKRIFTSSTSAGYNLRRRD
ncbi:uncharacterized protein [Haliotis cracherodii]|uniref:uncharacterized protein n=1 Tax=Haliotis cracherodii TaxID=6455 RepID=UPI0039EABBCF